MAKASEKATKQQTISVEIEISEKVLKENEDLQKIYDSKKNILTFGVSNEIPKEISKELQEFLSGPVIGSKQIVLFNPLISAINSLQELKNLKYEPLLSDELETELKEKCFLEHLSYDLEDKKYIFDFNDEIKNGKTDEDLAQLEARTFNEIQKFIEKQHKNSHQVFKDAKKIVGSFNSSIRDTKKDIKQPYIDTGKQIDTVFNLLKQESDNTKNALEANFEECLNIEEEKKRLKEEAKKAEELEKIAKLSKENEEQQKTIDQQNLISKIAKIKNDIKYSRIGSISSDVAANSLNLNLEGLNSKRKEIENKTFDLICEGLETDVLSPEELSELQKEFEESKERWFNIIDREINLRNEKAKAEANRIKLEALKEQTPSFQDDDSQPFETVSSNNAIPKEELTEDDLFETLIESLKEFKEQGLNLVNEINQTNFNDEFYQKKKEVIVNNSLKQINEWNIKLYEWAEDQKTKYINFKNQNKQ